MWPSDENLRPFLDVIGNAQAIAINRAFGYPVLTCHTMFPIITLYFIIIVQSTGKVTQDG